MTEANDIRPTPVAIIGIGCLFPRAGDPRAYWANILNRVDCIAEVPPERWDPADYFDADPNAPDHTYARRGGFLGAVDFAPLEFGITPKALEATDSTQLLGLLAARQALADAGYGPGRDFDRSRTSVILGVTGTQQLVIPLGARLGQPIWRRALRESGVEPKVAEAVVRRIADSYVGWQEDSFPGLLGNVVAGRIANRLNLHGTNCVADAACASSLSAMHLALLELSAGRCDVALSGGMDTFNDIFMYLCFSKTPALSPTGDARPFAADADGTILGEGLGCLVLKRLSDAERDGDRVYAVIRAIGTSSDGKGHAIYAPSPEGQVRAIRRAHALAGVTADSIELVEAHGTGTRAGDAAELAALTEVFRQAPRRGTWCAIGSVKSQIGHTKAAAGAAGLIKAALALHHKVLPPSIKVQQPAPALASGEGPFYVNTEKRPWLPADGQPRRAAVSSFGFGGSNYHCILEEYRPDKTAVDWDGQVQIVALSAANTARLREQLLAWPDAGDWVEFRRAARASRTAFRSSDPYRLVLATHPGQDWTRLRTAILSKLAAEPEADSWALPGGVYFGREPAAGKLALLFPGQGSQYPGMLRDLACQFPSFLEALREANGCCCIGENGATVAAQPTRLSDWIYPQPAFNDADRRKQVEGLTATDIAQPALAAVSLGALRVLQHFGVRADLLAGHSFGELTALCAAGRLTPLDFLRLAAVRGRLMAEAATGSGGMLAVGLSRTEAESLLRSQQLDLVIANDNAPQQTVLSGSPDAIERIATILHERGVSTRRLAVGAAFHSPQVAGAASAFLEALPPLAGSSGAVFANTTAQPYPADPDQARRQLARQLAEPVRFRESIDNLYAAGCRVFIEVGPGARLTGLVHATLQGRPYHAVAVDASSGKDPGQLDLARTLALVAALGHEVRLTAWDDAPLSEAQPPRTTASFAVRLTGANYRSQPPRPAEKKGTAPSTNERVISIVAMNNHPSTNGSSLPPVRVEANASLSLAQQNLAALQQLSEQTAQLHRQFLDGQERALQVFQTLLQQQQALLGGANMTPPAARIAPPPRTAPENGKAEVTARLPTPPVSAAAVRPETPAAPVLPPARPEAHEIAEDRVLQVLQAVIADKTGYPAEMLTADMDLDTDLGIDSIKRVEIFAALQERLPEAPVVGTEQMPSLRTLADVTAFLRNGTTAAQKKNVRAPAEPLSEQQLPRDTEPESPTLRRLTPLARPFPEAARRARRPLLQGSVVWIVAEPSALAERLGERLQLLGHMPRRCDPAAASAAGAGTPAAVVVLAGVRDSDDAFLVNVFQWLQRIGPGFREAAQSRPVLLTVSRLDGGFGLMSGSDLADPASGGLAGLVKTAAREWPAVRCRALDLAPSVDADEAALAIAAELELDGPIEVGIHENGLTQVVLEPVAAPAEERMWINPGDVLLVTGGARGVTAEVAVALAQRFAPRIVLLGRSAPPAAEPDWLAELDDVQEIKRAVLEHAAQPLSPRQLEDQYRGLVAGREIRRTLSRIAAAGAEAHYRQVDVRDAAAVRELVGDVRRRYGPVKGLVHGAGVIADRRIEDKTAEQFRTVYDTKVSGLRNLLAALEGEALESLVLFSSSTARFGRAGQADYAAANEVLNKMAQGEARRRPGCRVVAHNWGPWAGGMVHAGLQKIFADEGISLIPLQAGARLAADLVAADAPGPVEQVVLAESSASLDPSGAEQPEPKPTSLSFSREVSLETCPVLRSHVIGGRAVVPLVLHLEWLAHGAAHANPGLAFLGFDDLRILRGVKLHADQSRTVRIMAGKATQEQGVFRVPVEVRQSRGDGSDLHASTTILLGSRLPEAPPLAAAEQGLAYPYAIAETYQDRLFHGPLLHGIQRVDSVSPNGIAGVVATAPPPAQWLARPLRGSWLAEPLVLDASFQLMVLWCWEVHGMPLLPTALGRYRQYCRSFPTGLVEVRARLRRQAPQRVWADIDYVAADGRLLARLEGGECVLDASLKESFRRNQLAAPAPTV